jgi:hypothetical protein
MAGTLAGTAVWVSPAVAYRADAASTAVFRPMPGGAFTRVDLADGGGATATVIQIPPR